MKKHFFITILFTSQIYLKQKKYYDKKPNP